MKIIWNKVTWYSKLLAVIVLAGVIWLGFYFNSEFEKVADIKPVQSVVQNNFVADTSNWKTYRNEKYGFEFSYHEDLFKEFEDGEKYYNNSDNLVSVRSIKNYHCGSGFHEIKVVVNNSTSDSFIPKDASNVNFAGKDALLYEAYGGSGGVKMYYMKISDNTYLVITASMTCNIEGSYEVEKTNLDNVLSTFKFTK